MSIIFCGVKGLELIVELRESAGAEGSGDRSLLYILPWPHPYLPPTLSQPLGSGRAPGESPILAHSGVGVYPVHLAALSVGAARAYKGTAGLSLSGHLMTCVRRGVGKLDKLTPEIWRGLVVLHSANCMCTRQAWLETALASELVSSVRTVMVRRHYDVDPCPLRPS